MLVKGATENSMRHWRNKTQNYRENGNHYCDVIMGAVASQITSLTTVYSTVYSDADQRKHQSSASLAFVRGIHRGPVNSPHKWPVTRKMFPFDYVIMFEWAIYTGTADRNYLHFIHFLSPLKTYTLSAYTNRMHLRFRYALVITHPIFFIGM